MTMEATKNPTAQRGHPDRGHSHGEAFCLMWYACSGKPDYEATRAPGARLARSPECGHRERYWNSRDGVTPFGTRCPSCGGQLVHTDWPLDLYAPDHKPHHGQRVWIDMTRERAELIARERVALFRSQGHEVPDDHLPSLIESIYHDGTAPDCVVWGYQEAPAATA
jgi:hypothetical protein